MKLTIDKALQTGIAAHKEGKLQDAERLYRLILKSQPSHPDANHNLGVLAISVNRVDLSLPFFKTALEANPKIEQFWLSYICALIDDNKSDEAMRLLEQAKQRGVNYKKLRVVEKQIPTQVGSSITANPSKKQLDSLLEYYQKGRLNVAEKLAKQITKEFPKHQFAWTVLGAVLQQNGKNSEAFEANQTAVMLSPKDAVARSNLGNTLKELGRWKESEANYKQAINLQPDFPQAHYNLGVMLSELGRWKDAEKSFKETIALQPSFPQAHYNLGNTLKELGKTKEVEASYIQAIKLKPDYAEAHNNLGNALKELGRLEEAKGSYSQTIKLKPDYAEAMLNLSINLGYMDALEAEIHAWKKLFRIDMDNYGFRAGVNLAICFFLKGNFSESKKYLLETKKIKETTSSEFKNARAYWVYLSALLNWHEKKYFNVKCRKTDEIFYVIGESHALIAHQLCLQISHSNLLCKSKLIRGCKQWHLGNSVRNQYKNQFERIFYSIPKSSKILLTIGEIDCRLDSGILMHSEKSPEKTLEQIIVTTVKNYLAYVARINCSHQHKIFIQGVPCPNIETINYSEKEVKQLIEVIIKFNRELKSKSKQKGFEFLDVHRLTDRGDGFSNAVWHIDDIHLSPEGFLEAWSRYVSKQQSV